MENVHESYETAVEPSNTSKIEAARAYDAAVAMANAKWRDLEEAWAKVDEASKVHGKAHAAYIEASAVVEEKRTAYLGRPL